MIVAKVVEIQGNRANDKVFVGLGRKKGQRPFPPLRTFAEMAAEFGLTSAQLRGHMHMTHSHNPPQPKISSYCSRSVSNKYYNAAEMRAWWERHNAKRVEL